MNNLILWLGRLSGLAGATLCLVSVVARLAGKFWLGNFQVGTFLGAGTAALAFGCFCFLALLVDKPRGDTRG